ncbi:tetratricopeptide repeat protein [Pseudoalteromonas piscicida]|uniref:tetratricopeptide repeat protein n=1 Tax=Pseudoalteromonas piscicida TaxID=43662 RepID=UPI0032C1A369
MQDRNLYASQTHTGNGNNELTFQESEIARFELQQVTQHVIELAPDRIRKPLSTAISLITHGKQQDAALIISALESTNSLNHEASVALAALRVLSDKNPDSEDVKNLLENKKSCHNSFVIDLIVASLIRNDIINEEFDIALERYESISSPGNLTNNFYLKWLAEYKNIQKFYESNKLDLTTDTLIAIVYGYLRVDAVQDATKIVNRMKGKQELPHVRKLAYLCIAAQLNGIFGKAHYWTISTKEKSIVEKVIEESKHYIRSQDVDSNVINIVSACLYNTDFEDEELIELCLTKDGIQNKLPQEIEEQLHFIKSRDPKVFSDEELTKLLEAKSNPELRASIADKITKELKLNSLQYLYIQNLFTQEQLRNLLDQGLTVDSDDEFTKNVCKLRLFLIANEHSTELSVLNDLVNYVIQDIEKIGKIILPPLLLNIARGLQKHKLFEQAIKLLELCLPKEAWLSPLYDYYLDLLFQTKQYGKLTKALDFITEASWNFNCWALKATLHRINGDLGAEISSLEHLVKRHENNISVWHSLTSAYERAGAKTKIIELSRQIPTALFDKPTDEAWQILFSMMRNGLFNCIEPVVLKWFVEDPETISAPITDFALMGQFNGVEYDFSHTVGNIRSCYVLKNAQGKVLTKLIVDEYEGKHSNLLDSQSPHAQSLIQSTVGDAMQFGVEEFTVQEIVPPFLGAAWRIAPKIRTQQNDGSDVFQLIELPSGEDENIAESMANLLSKLTPEDEQNEIQRHPQLPIQIKANWLFETNNFESAIQITLDKDCVKNQIPETISDSKNLVLDLYSVAFISLLGLYKTRTFTDRNYFITSITKSLLETWLEHSKKEHLRASLGAGGKLLVSNEKHILNQRLVKGVEFILENTSLIQTQLEDIPINLVKFEDFMDTSTFSSLCACSLLGYDYLSFDHNFVMLFKDTNLAFANAHGLYLTSFDQLSFKEQQLSLCLLYTANVNVPVRYKTLTNLAITNRPEALSLIAHIINGWKPNSKDSDSFLNLLALLVLAGIRQRFFSKNIIDESIGAKLVFTALSCARLDTVEQGYIEDLIITLFIRVLELSPQSERFLKFIQTHLEAFATCNFLDIEYMNQVVQNHFRKLAN